MLEEMKEQSRQSECPHWVGHDHFCMTNRQETIPQWLGAGDTTRGTEGRAQGSRRWGRARGAGAQARDGEAGGWGSWLYTRWHGRCKYSSSWKSASLGVYRVLGVGVFYWSLSSLCWVPWPERLAWATPRRSGSHLGLHVGGEVQCVPLQFCEGNGGVLQVVEEDLDLCHDIMGPDVCG